MKAHVVLILVLMSLASLAWADSFPPAPVQVVGSNDGRYLVRFGFDWKIQVFATADDEKSYRLVSDFETLTHGQIMKALISKDGRYVITFENSDAPEASVGAEVICVYSKEGKRLRTWRFEEIVTKENQALIPATAKGSKWFFHEVGIGGTPETLYLMGPTEFQEPEPHQYIYALDLNTWVWRKGR